MINIKTITVPKEGNYKSTTVINKTTDANSAAIDAFWKGSEANNTIIPKNSNNINTQGYEVSVGYYNKSTEGSLFEVGNGTSDTNRSNVFEAHSDGNTYTPIMNATEEINSPYGNIDDLVSYNVTAIDDINTPLLNATTINSSNIKNTGNIDSTSISTYTGNINNINSDNINNTDTIKTKNLEVTGSAHFFELIIDKIKAAGGAVLFTPCDGFEIERIESVDQGYKLYWRCRDDDGNQRDNMWKVNDQALCQSFNQATVGTTHDISNKYYWSLVTEVSDNTDPVLIDDQYYHYITISTTTYDGTVNPSVGDNIVMLGYRGDDDVNRQSAIYISAYSSLDKGLTAPLLAQYRGINDFDLESHRYSYFDAIGGKFVGDFEIGNKSIEQYIIDKIDSAAGGTPYIGDNGDWYIWDSETKTYKDSGIKAKGEDATSITYQFCSTLKNIYVVPDTGMLVVQVNGQIYKFENSTSSIILPSKTNGYHVQYKLTSSSSTWSEGNIIYDTIQVKEEREYKRTSNTNSIYFRLVYTENNKTSVIYSWIEDVKLQTTTLLSINTDLQEIKGTVANHETSIDALNTNVTNNTNNITTLTQTVNSIESTVSSHTTSIDTLNNSVKSINSDISSINQRADSIESTVKSVKEDVPGINVFRGLNGDGWSGIYNIDKDFNYFTFTYNNIAYMPPINNISGDYCLSFELWQNNSVTISLYEFLQTYSISNKFDVNIDFLNYDPCTVYNTSKGTYTQTEIDNLFITGSTTTYTIPTNANSVLNDMICFAITNSTTNKVNYVYGQITSISSTTYTITVTTVLLPANKIWTLSTSDITTGLDINKMHKTDDGRYWVRFKESNSNIKTFVISVTSNNDTAVMDNIMLEESVSEPHKYNGSEKVSQSMIKQTAEDITLAVNDTYVKINEGNITLNGDTKINGSINITDNSTGFILSGETGITQISPQSIGSSSEFIRKTSYTLFSSFNNNIVKTRSDSQYIIFQMEFFQYIGTLKKQQTISLSNFIADPILLDTLSGNKNVTLDSIILNIYDDNFKTYYMNTYTNTNKISNTDSLVISVDGNYYTSYTISYKANLNLWSKDVMFFKMNITLNWDNIISKKYYTLIGYDGFASSFGNNNAVYFGPNNSIIHYGNWTLNINDEGISNLNRRNIKILSGSSDGNNPVKYTISGKIDTVLAISNYTWITLPSNPTEGTEIVVIDKSPNYCWINTNGMYLVPPNYRIDGASIQTQYELVGNWTWTFIYSSTCWFMVAHQ